MGRIISKAESRTNLRLPGFKMHCDFCWKFCSLVTEKEYEDYWREWPIEVSFDDFFENDCWVQIPNNYSWKLNKDNVSDIILDSYNSLNKEINTYVYACIIEGGRAPTTYHKSLEEAREECKRLATKENKKCTLVQRIMEYEPTTTLKETKF